MKDDFPIDPILPDRFDFNPIEDRSQEELDVWWCRPYATTNADGTFSVACLDGGASDRPTWLGIAQSIEEARAIGEKRRAKLGVSIVGNR